MKQPRPLLLYGLVFLFLIASFTAVLSVVGTLKAWNWLLVFDAGPDPLLQIFKSAFLALAWATAALLLWFRIRWAARFGSLITIVNLAWFWFDRLVTTQNPLPFNRQVFWMIAAVLLTGMVLGSLIAIQPYFRPSNNDPEYKPGSSRSKG